MGLDAKRQNYFAPAAFTYPDHALRQMAMHGTGYMLEEVLVSATKGPWMPKALPLGHLHLPGKAGTGQHHPFQGSRALAMLPNSRIYGLLTCAPKAQSKERWHSAILRAAHAKVAEHHCLGDTCRSRGMGKSLQSFVQPARAYSCARHSL